MTRLDKIAALIKPNSIVCDIGCDHAYLLLKLYNKISKGFACDIAQKPLDTAIKTIRENNIGDKITPILSNGLQNIKQDTFDTLVIAGMGGELISDILEDCKYIKNPRYDIFLQPMTKASDLRLYLYTHGFSIVNEVISIEDRRVYTILQVKYTGEVKSPNIVDCFVSDPLINDPNFDKFISHHINRLEIIIKNMKDSQNTQNFEHYNNLINKLKEYNND